MVITFMQERTYSISPYTRDGKQLIVTATMSYWRVTSVRTITGDEAIFEGSLTNTAEIAAALCLETKVNI